MTNNSEGSQMIYDSLAITSSIVSASASLFVVQHIWRSRNNNTSHGRRGSVTSPQHKLTPYHRLLIGLSIFDMLSSLMLLFIITVVDTSAPNPACTATAYLQVVGITTAGCYNLSLSVAFLLILRYGKSDDDISRYWEPYFHGFGIGFNVVLYTIGLPLEIFNPRQSPDRCFLSPYPPDCYQGFVPGDVECTRGADYAFLFWYLLLGTFVFTLVGMVSCNVSIYLKVRTLENRGSTWSLASTNTRGKSRRVAAQSFLFCGGYLMTYLIAILYQFIPVNHGVWWYDVISALETACFPLQGLFDALVYFRPRYLDWRKACRIDSRWFALKMTVGTVHVPHRQHSSASRMLGGFGGSTASSSTNSLSVARMNPKWQMPPKEVVAVEDGQQQMDECAVGVEPEASPQNQISSSIAMDQTGTESAVVPTAEDTLPS